MPNKKPITPKIKRVKNDSTNVTMAKHGDMGGVAGIAKRGKNINIGGTIKDDKGNSKSLNVIKPAPKKEVQELRMKKTKTPIKYTHELKKKTIKKN